MLANSFAAIRPQGRIMLANSFAAIRPQVGNKISWDNTDIVSLAGVGRIVGVW